MLINAVEKKYQLESLQAYEQMTNTDAVADVQVDWKNAEGISYATFTYGDYNYYISLECPMEEDGILDIVEEMLLSA